MFYRIIFFSGACCGVYHAVFQSDLSHLNTWVHHDASIHKIILHVFYSRQFGEIADAHILWFSVQDNRGWIRQNLAQYGTAIQGQSSPQPNSHPTEIRCPQHQHKWLLWEYQLNISNEDFYRSDHSLTESEHSIRQGGPAFKYRKSQTLLLSFREHPHPRTRVASNFCQTSILIWAAKKKEKESNNKTEKS